MARPPALLLGLFLGLAIVIDAGYSQAANSIVEDGIVFGRQQHMSGVYFSNFENSRFTACDRLKGQCDRWAEREGEVVSCAAPACADLESRIKRLVGSHDKWALYRIDFIGRRSVKRMPKKYLGDTERKVYVEKIETFSLIETE